ncbi:MAG TPA: Wzz/FepE/Etk N-terminal domain-containing protein [Bryobacteraceae bacterium]|jgi:uncharacterized protein involved in exopolysaccharide biosynthesis|nr:Wzz/FepE/Etk N-terminal domain-containing protein [Bryobacteraceae bacterium]
MSESFDAFRYISYLRSNWRAIAASCGIAVALALAISLALPPKYTATARVLIDPPAGSDPRSSMAVSPVYLESLKTYSEFASSDSLFQKAAQRFHLTGAPIEALKRSVLKVELLRNTRVMEISATLPDAQKAHALVKFLADSTVDLNRASLSASDSELLDDLAQQANGARQELRQTDTEWAKALATEPVAELSAEMEEVAAQRSKLEEQIQTEEVQIADLQQRLHAGENTPDLRNEQSDAQARLAEINKQLARLDRDTNEREKTLGVREAHRNQLDNERKERQTALAALEAKLRDARSASGFHGERLQVVDPGIVPERPSSPDIPLNIAAALFAGLALPVLYLTLRMNFEARRAYVARGGFRAVARTADE